MHLHLVGIGACEMAQLAILLRGAGHEVSGSGASVDPLIETALGNAGVNRLEGFPSENLAQGVERVVTGVNIDDQNPEVQRARAMGIARSTIGETLGELFLR